VDDEVLLQADGLRLNGLRLLSHPQETCHYQHAYNARFQRLLDVGVGKPKALPWAGMSQAFGLLISTAGPKSKMHTNERSRFRVIDFLAMRATVIMPFRLLRLTKLEKFHRVERVPVVDQLISGSKRIHPYDKRHYFRP